MSEEIKTPVKAKERIVVLDVLRGFALVGILLANIFSWSGIRFIPFDDLKLLGFWESDIFLYKMMMIFVDTKFYTIFSILFGIGFCIQFSKNKDVPGFLPLYMRRLFLLFCIGTVHALIWSGDILMLYALMGYVFLLFRNLPTKKVLVASVIFFILPLITDIVVMNVMEHETVKTEKNALKVYPDWSPDQIVEGFESDNVIDNFNTNFHNLKWRWYEFIPSGRPFKVLALFLLGFYLFQVKFFTTTALNKKALVIFLIFGLGGTFLSKEFAGGMSSFSSSWENVLYKVFHEIGQIPLALAYISILAIMVDKFPKLKIWNALKKYGRMSLTSYIGHTVLGIIFFYPIGLGYFGDIALTQLYIFAVPLILIIQIGYATIWFKYFKFGPIEWIWRCATYQKLFPIKK